MTTVLRASDSCLQLIECEIPRAIEQVREIVHTSRLSALGCSISLGDDLSDCFDGEVVACFLAHDFAEQRTIEGKKRRALFGSRCVVPVHPVHDEPELKARRKWRGYMRLDDLNPDVSGVNAIQH